MRSPSDMDIIVLDITNRCFLRCSNCTRDIAHQKSTKAMTPETFRQALATLLPWWQPGKVIGIIGGEPTLSEHFETICRIFQEEFNPGTLAHGREPIADFPAFAETRLYDRSNGKGLWTSFGPKFMDHYEVIMETFSHWNPNDHSAGGPHQASLIDAREMMAALNLPWEDWPKYRDNCWLQNSWSASVTPRGKAYFCERAAQLDELYNDGRNGWPLEDGWWKRKPEQFGDQLKLCEMCSMALPGPSQIDNKDTDIISDNHRVRLQMAGSPAVQGGRYELFDPAKHTERREITTKDNYVSGQRVSQDNPHVKPRKVTGVVTCVGRAEDLAKTIANNVKCVDELLVVTMMSDDETRKVVEGSGATLHACLDSRMLDDAFNKGRLINFALERIDKPDWVLLTDADILLHEDTLDFIKGHALNPGCLYGTHRLPRESYIDSEPNGYFQLFNKRASAILWPGAMSENFCSAGGIDSWFMQQFEPGKRILLDKIPVTHIHQCTLGECWNGSRNGRACWRQLGMLTLNGYVPIETPRIKVGKIRLTDTLHGEQVELETPQIPMEVAKINNGRILFRGQDIGHHHIHVAYWSEP